MGGWHKRVAKRMPAMMEFNSPFGGGMRFPLGGKRDQNHPWTQELLMA
ncbi:hypothetical protein FHS55_002240 [Angulomicrobium tetraedrale]|uniref:Uncharacterized protein n=1 Tax=Ancylobacter tetraedralis TaxID=217068 RepID=A0A839ZA56_9HYPH|nr:hypothetical protein [Ancylobacter tetraedralis]MBB3771631.1 hypothetical protein [Ancylobacter tetraedralis]